jgi:hypothetical protein
MNSNFNSLFIVPRTNIRIIRDFNSKGIFCKHYIDKDGNEVTKD